ncbi:MAG: ABC transporter permease, partial [Leptospiraceae bacterium]|nr:ABC transporter permease [Leptospiraceae bacterium]
MKKEVFHFLFFLFTLSLVSFSLASFRIKDRAYLHADSGVSKEYLKEMENEKPSFLTSYSQFVLGIFRFQLGNSQSGENILNHIGTRLVPTLQLALFSVLIGSFTGILAGITSLYFRSELFHSLLLSLAGFILSTPIFVVAILLLLLFFLYWELLPPGGYVAGDLSYLILPGLALGSRIFARLFFFTYAEGKKEEDTYYILFLKSRGFSRFTILYKHLLLKIFPVLLIFIFLDFSSLLSGAIIVEEIFLFPGIGKSLYYSIQSMDEALLRALLFYCGLIFYSFTRLSRFIQE